MSISSTLVERADIRFIEAADVLRPFVGCFWVITAQADATIRVVPDASTAMSIELQPHPSGWCLRGPLVRPDERRFAEPVTMVGIRLRPGASYLVSGIATDAIVGRRIRLSEAPGFHTLTSREHHLRTPADCVDVLQRFLIERLKGAAIHDVVTRALHEFDRANGCLRVTELASRCGVSPRHLNRLMRVWVGYGPKYFGRVVRFQSALTQIEQAPARPAAALAAETGYFDQAHLTQDLNRLGGATPARLASRCVADFSKTRCDGPL